MTRATISDFVIKVRESGNVLPNQLKRCGPVRQIFSPALEVKLTKYFRTRSLMSHSLAPLETRKIAFKFAVQPPPVHQIGKKLKLPLAIGSLPLLKEIRHYQSALKNKQAKATQVDSKKQS